MMVFFLFVLHVCHAQEHLTLGVGSLGLSLDCKLTTKKEGQYFLQYHNSPIKTRKKEEVFSQDIIKTHQINGFALGKQWGKKNHFRLGLKLELGQTIFSSTSFLIASRQFPYQMYSSYTIDISSIAKIPIWLEVGVLFRSNNKFDQPQVYWSSEYIEEYFVYEGSYNDMGESWKSELNHVFFRSKVYPMIQMRGEFSTVFQSSVFSKHQSTGEEDSLQMKNLDAKDIVCTPESQEPYCEDLRWKGDAPMYVSTAQTLYQIREKNKLERIADFEVAGTGSLEEQPKMTDIAMNFQGDLYGIAGMIIYKIHSKTGKMKFLTVVNQSMDGFTAMPNGDLVAAGNSIVVIDPTTGRKFTLVPEGKYTSTGDIQYFNGDLYWITKEQNDSVLVKVAISGLAEKIGTLEISNIEGLGVYGEHLIAFTNTGGVFKLDPTTGEIIAKETMEKIIPINSLENPGVENKDISSETNETLDEAQSENSEDIENPEELQASESMESELDVISKESEDGSKLVDVQSNQEEVDQIEKKETMEKEKIQILHFTGATSNFQTNHTIE
jgi:hypothetical protein